MNYDNILTNIENVLKNEEIRQSNTISLIASENIASKNVRNACASVFTNKYAEGYPNARYYAGCEYADEIEIIAIDLAKQIFNCSWANVQPHSGSQANEAVYFALLQPGDTILSLNLEAGGHLTHGAKVSSVSRYFKIVNYTLDENGLIDMDAVEKLALEHKPKLIIAGASAYPRFFDWSRFRAIADSVNAYLMADIAHIAGLVAGDVHASPFPFAHVVTSTTHKTLRGPRGGIILSNDEEIGAKIDKAVFPAIQGGPLMNTIAAKAVAFAEILHPDFAIYTKNVVENARILADKLVEAGGQLVTNGTDNHLMILDCNSFEMSGQQAQTLLLDANVLISKSKLLSDSSWLKPNGIRIGTPYITTLGVTDISEFADIFCDALKTKNNSNLKNFTIATAQKLYPKFL